MVIDVVINSTLKLLYMLLLKNFYYVANIFINASLIMGTYLLIIIFYFSILWLR